MAAHNLTLPKISKPLIFTALHNPCLSHQLHPHLSFPSPPCVHTCPSVWSAIPLFTFAWLIIPLLKSSSDVISPRFLPWSPPSLPQRSSNVCSYKTLWLSFHLSSTFIKICFVLLTLSLWKEISQLSLFFWHFYSVIFRYLFLGSNCLRFG